MKGVGNYKVKARTHQVTANLPKNVPSAEKRKRRPDQLSSGQDHLSSEPTHYAETRKRWAQKLCRNRREGELRQRATLQRTLRQRGYLLEDFEAKWLTARGLGSNRREMRSFDAKIRELMATGKQCIVLHSVIRDRMTQVQGKRPADKCVWKHAWSKCELEASQCG